MKLSALVLAAGKSSRMRSSISSSEQTNKLLLCYNNQTILAWVHQNIKNTNIFDEVIFVFPKIIENELNNEIKKLNLSYCQNLAFDDQGLGQEIANNSMSQSIYYGLQKIAKTSEMVAIFLADMPKLSSDNILDCYQKLKQEIKTQPRFEIFQPVLNNKDKRKPGHPIFIKTKLAFDLFSYQTCLKYDQPKQILAQAQEKKFMLENLSNNHFFDIDTKDDYDKLLLDK